MAMSLKQAMAIYGEQAMDLRGVDGSIIVQYSAIGLL
jgi:hypothetical protein